MPVIGRGVLDVGFDPKQIEQAGKQQVLPSAKRIAGDVASTFAAVKLISIGKQGLDELKEAEVANAQLATVIQSTGNAAGISADHIDDLSQKALKLAGVDDEAAKKADTLLLQLGKFANTDLGHENFDRAANSAVNLSVRMGTDVPAAAQALAVVLQAPEKGLGRLRRTIGDLSDEQQKSLDHFIAVGDQAGAQSVILDKLDEAVGGAGAAYGETLAGKVQIAQESMKNMKAELVAGAAPALKFTADVVTGLTEKFDELPAGAQTVIGGLVLVGGAAGALIRPVSDAVRIFESLKAARVGAAVAEDAQALNSAASVSGLYSKQAGGLASTLGKAGVAGAAIAGAVALYSYGESLNKTSLDQEELTRLTKLGVHEQVDAFKTLIALSGGGAFSGALDDVIAKLKDMGPAGVGTLKQLRDSFAGQPEVIAKFDAAIGGAKESQSNLNTVTAAGNAELGETADKVGGVGTAVVSAADAAKAGTEALQKQFDAIAQSADKAFAAALQLAPADIRVQRGAITIEEDKQKIADAEKKLAFLRANAAATPEEIADAERGLQSARLDLEEATLNQAEAETELKTQQDQVNGVTDTAAQKSHTYLDNLVALAGTLDGPVKDALLTYIWNQTIANNKADEFNRSRSGDFTGTPEGQHVNRGAVKSFAAGGYATNAFHAAEHGFEVLLNEGMYQAPPGGGYVLNHRQSLDFLTGGSQGRGGITIENVNVYGDDASRAMRSLPDELRAAAFLAGV